MPTVVAGAELGRRLREEPERNAAGKSGGGYGSGLGQVRAEGLVAVAGGDGNEKAGEHGSSKTGNPAGELERVGHGQTLKRGRRNVNRERVCWRGPGAWASVSARATLQTTGPSDGCRPVSDASARKPRVESLPSPRSAFFRGFGASDCSGPVLTRPTGSAAPCKGSGTFPGIPRRPDAGYTESTPHGTDAPATTVAGQAPALVRTR